MESQSINSDDFSDTQEPSPHTPPLAPTPPPLLPLSMVTTSAYNQDSDSDMALHPDQRNRSRQKKFTKHFKGLPIEENVHKRYACALIGDILLQGHLYVTDNYLGFHSNVFGYVTRIQIPLTSVISITKEKTAKIFPNAVAVSTEDETHTFTSLISRDATFKAMTKAWRKAVTKHNLSLSQTNVDEIGEDDIEDEEDEIDGDIVDYESTDSMTSANQLNGFILAAKTEDPKSPFQLKRASATSNAIFYNARPCLSHQNSQQSHAAALPVTPPQSSTSSYISRSRTVISEALSFLTELQKLQPGAGHPGPHPPRLVPDHVLPRHQARGITEES